MKNFALGVLTGVAAYFGFGVYVMHVLNQSEPGTMEDFYGSVQDAFFDGCEGSDGLVDYMMTF